MPRLPFLISLLTVRSLFGQTSPVDPQSPSPSSVVQVKRTPASSTAVPPNTDSFVDHFDFGANVRALAESMETPTAKGATPPVVLGPSAVPQGYRPTTDVAHSTTARSKPLSSALLGGHNKTELRRGRTVACCSPSERDCLPWCAHRCGFV